jgi:exonuclease III
MARLLSLNIEHSKHLGRLIPFLSEYKPDVVCLQELVASDIEAIQEQTGLAYSHFVPMAQHPLDGPGQPFGVGILVLSQQLHR